MSGAAKAYMRTEPAPALPPPSRGSGVIGWAGSPDPGPSLPAEASITAPPARAGEGTGNWWRR